MSSTVKLKNKSNKILNNFKDLSIVPNEKLIKLIKDQSEIIQLSEWEIASFIDLCKVKKCLSRGLEVLFEYADLIDKITLNFNSVDEIYKNLINLIGNFSIDGEEDVDNSTSVNSLKIKDLTHFFAQFDKLANSMLSFYICISKIRKYQWTPQLLYLSTLNPAATFTKLLEHLSDNLRFLILKENLLSQLLPTRELQASIVLVSPSSYINSIQELLSKDTSRTLHSSTFIHSCISTIKDINSIENKIVTTWNSFDLLYSESKISVQKLFPILRLPYRNVKPPTSDMDWFSISNQNYKVFISTLEKAMNIIIHPNESLLITSPSKSPSASSSPPSPSPPSLSRSRTAPTPLLNASSPSPPSQVTPQLSNRPSTTTTQNEDLNSKEKSSYSYSSSSSSSKSNDINQTNSTSTSQIFHRRVKSNPTKLNKVVNKIMLANRFINKQRHTDPSINVDSFNKSKVNDDDNDDYNNNDDDNEKLEDNMHVSANENEGLNPLMIKNKFNNQEQKHRTSSYAANTSTKTNNHSAGKSISFNTGSDSQMKQHSSLSETPFPFLLSPNKQKEDFINEDDNDDYEAVINDGNEDEDEDEDVNNIQKFIQNLNRPNFKSQPMFAPRPSTLPSRLAKSSSPPSEDWNEPTQYTSPIKITTTPTTTPTTANHKRFGSRPNSASSTSYVTTNHKQPSSRPNSASSTKSSKSNPNNALSKSLQTLELYSSLMSPITRPEARAESQVVAIALRNLNIEGSTIVELATRKIQLWWNIYYPRHKLKVRLSLIQFIHGIFDKVIQSVEGISKKKLLNKNRMLKNGAAIKIQRTFISWKTNILNNVLAIQNSYRRFRARIRILRIVSVVKAAILIFRFMRRFFAKRKKYKKMKKVNLKRILIGVTYSINEKTNLSYITYHNKEEELIDLYMRDRKVKEFYKNSEIVPAKKITGIISHKVKKSKEWDGISANVRKSIIRMQRAFRKSKQEKRIKATDHLARLVRFVALVKAKFNLKKIRATHLMVIKVQKIWRGKSVRFKLMKKLKACLKILSAYRSYKNFLNLKQNLRRIERPLNISLLQIRNIPMQIIHNQEIKLKISVWWHPLLHIVSERDYVTITSSKNPQIIHPTLSFPVFQPVASEVDKEKLKRFNVLNTSEREISTKPEIVNENTKTTRKNSMRKTPSNQPPSPPPSPSPSLPPIKTPQNTSFLRKPDGPVSIMAMIRESVDDSEDEDEDEDEEDEEGEEEENNKNDEEQNNLSSCDEFDTSKIKRDTSNQRPIGRLSISSSLPFILSSAGGGGGGGGGRGAMNLINKFRQTIVSPLFRKTQEVKEAELANTYSCDFKNSTVNIPGCHGNSVIKFEFIDGDRVFAANSFYMSNYGRLMFWGGHFNQSVSHLQQRRGPQQAGNRIARSASDDIDQMLFEFKITSGTPNKSKSQWVRTWFKSGAQYKRKMFLSFNFFETWKKNYISFDGRNLIIFESKNTTIPLSQFHVSDLKSVEKPDEKVGSRISSLDLIIISKIGDEIILKFPDVRSRDIWNDLLNEVLNSTNATQTTTTTT